MCCLVGAMIISQIFGAWQMITLRMVLLATSGASTAAFALFAALNPIFIRADLQTIDNVANGRITVQSGYLQLRACGGTMNARATLALQRAIAGKAAMDI